MRKLFLSIFCSLVYSMLMAQSSYVPLNSPTMHMLDRMEIKQGRVATPQEFSTSTKAHKRIAVARYVDSFELSSAKLSKVDYANLGYIQTDNFEYSSSESTRSKKRVWNTGIYKHKAALVDYTEGDVAILFNPVLYQKFEYDKKQGEMLWYNNRGVEMRGRIGNTFSFYTQVGDVLHNVNTWDKEFYDRDSVIPGQAFLKTSDHKNFDYWQASGYAAFQAGKYFDFQFGHGRNFIGNGYRTFMMSDFSRDHLFLRVNTRVWKINYTNIWGQMYDYVKPGQSRLPKRHYYATTHANINIGKSFNLGLFQTISFQRDSGYSDGGYDLQYFNPIIFYKPIENGMNSPDKTILGLDWKYNFVKHFSFYGQFVISEMVLNEMIGNNGWAGNKAALQVGLKYIDVFGISNLDLQVEHNRANPYMYSSFSSKNAYVNYNQNMAHPTGANFKESIVILQYQPTAKLFIWAKGLVSTFGNDTNGSNWGKDIRKPFGTYENEYGNFIGQGVTTHQYIGELIVSYMFWHNMFVDLQMVYRKNTSVLPQFESQTFNPAVSLRWNINAMKCDY